MSFTIRWNIRTAHLQGVAERTVYTGDGEDNGSGVVPYYAQSACAALTRSGFRMGTGDTLDTLADGLTVLRDFAEARGIKVCANCERAAVAALEADYDVAELKAREAAQQLDAAENFEDEPRIAIAEERAERLADEYADLAAVIGRCRIFGCEAPTHESSAWCEEHTEPDDTEDTASAIEAETAARHEADNAALMLAATAAPATYAAALVALPVGTDVALYLPGDTTVTGSIAGTGTDGAMVKLDNGGRRQVAYSVVESFEFFNHDTEEWVDPIADADARAYAADALANERASFAPVDPAVAAAGHASTQGKPYVPTGESYGGCEARIYHNGVGSPCARPRGHEGPNGAVHRTTTGIEWMNGQTRPLYCPYARTSKGCEDCKEHGALVDRILACGKATTYADAEALAVAMEEEPEAFVPLEAAERNRLLPDDFADARPVPAGVELLGGREDVVARLDHTEPGKAIALIIAGHGREHAPQAWLAHEGHSWLLVDDYDGDTFNVKGPDAERAVHAWAALLGLRIDALTVEVEYAGGPVSPPMRAPEGPVAPLNWVWAGSGPAADVHEAHGRAHDYQVTEHADAAGASLVAFLRGTTVDTYRRGYMTADDARAAAEHYEARYGSAYVPAE